MRNDVLISDLCRSARLAIESVHRLRFAKQLGSSTLIASLVPRCTWLAHRRAHPTAQLMLDEVSAFQHLAGLDLVEVGEDALGWAAFRPTCPPPSAIPAHGH